MRLGRLGAPVKSTQLAAPANRTLTVAIPQMSGAVGDPRNLPIPVTVTDPSGSVDELTLSVDATSNPAVVPASAVSFGGCGAERTVLIAPVGVGSAVTSSWGHNELDIEASARAGDRIYWESSLGNTKDGTYDPAATRCSRRRSRAPAATPS